MKSFKNFITETKKKKHIVHKAFIGKHNVGKPHVIHKAFIGKHNIKKSKKKGLHEKVKDKVMHRLYDLTSPASELGKRKHNHLRDEMRNNASLTSEDHEHIKNYTGDMHHPINRALFRQSSDLIGSRQNQSTPRDVQKADEGLSNAIKKHKTSKNFHVFSGMRSPENLERSRDGRIHLTNPAYTSTSISSDQGHNFGSTDTHEDGMSKHIYKKPEGSETPVQVTPQEHIQERKGNRPGQNSERYKHVAKIHIPAGSHGVYAADHSEYNNEKEHILHKNARISFHPEPTVDHETKTVLWHGRLEHDGVQATRHNTRKSDEDKQLKLDL